MTERWSAWVERYITLTSRRSGWIVLAWALAAAVLSFAIPRIKVNPNLEALLPADTRALTAADELRDRVPSSSPHYLLITSSDPQLNRRLAREMTKRVREWPETLSAISRRDPTYFMDRRLLFFKTERLESLADDTEQLVDVRTCNAMPGGCFTLEEEPELPTEAELREELSAQPDVRALLGLLGVKALPEGSAPTSSGPSSPDQALLGDLCAPDGTVCSVQIFVDGKPTDFAFAESVVNKSEALFEDLRPDSAPDDLRMATSGPYRNVVMTKGAVGNDLKNTAILSLMLMALLLKLQFRGGFRLALGLLPVALLALVLPEALPFVPPTAALLAVVGLTFLAGGRAFISLLLPLALAGLVTLGLIALFHPTLNLISTFTLAILAGLGIDFGVHLLTHYGECRSSGEQPNSALKGTFQSLRGPMLVAGVTTASGFAALAAARFRGFAEMGVVAALGVAISFLAYFTLFPALTWRMHHHVPESTSTIRPWRFLDHTFRNPRLVATWTTRVGLVLGLVAAVIGTQISFEYDFGNLRPKKVGHGIPWGKTLHGTTRPAIVVLAQNGEQLEATAAALRKDGPAKLRLAENEPWIITPASFLPPDQPQRLASLARLKKAVERGLKYAKGEERDRLERWLPDLSVTSPIEVASLPDWVTTWLSEKDGKFGSYGLVYSGHSGRDARQMEELAGILDEWSDRFTGVTFASASALIGIVIPGLRGDTPLMLALAFAGLCLGTLVVGRSWRRLLAVLAPLTLAMAMALGISVLLDLRINLYNLIVFPMAFGIGVDGAVYVVWALSGCNDEPARGWSHFPTTARGVIGSTLTTTAGFGSLLVASNPGLSSLGQLALVTFLSTLVANLIWQPAFLWWLEHRRSKVGLQ